MIFYIVDSLQHWVRGFPQFSDDFALTLNLLFVFSICFNDSPIQTFIFSWGFKSSFPTFFPFTNHDSSWLSGFLHGFSIVFALFWPCFPYLSIFFPSESSQPWAFPGGGRCGGASSCAPRATPRWRRRRARATPRAWRRRRRRCRVYGTNLATNIHTSAQLKNYKS